MRTGFIFCRKRKLITSSEITTLFNNFAFDQFRFRYRYVCLWGAIWKWHQGFAFSSILVASLVASGTVLLVTVSFSNVIFVFVGSSICAVAICCIFRYAKANPAYIINITTMNIFLIEYKLINKLV